MLSFAGVVLAGGESRRMGQTKALIEKDGVALWQRQVDALRTARVDPIFVSVRTDQNWLPSAVASVRDDGKSGPFGGIEAALNLSRGSHLFALAVDVPFVPQVWWELLRAQCVLGVGAVGQQENGFFEPLAAIYPKQMLDRILAARVANDFALQNLLAAAVAAGEMRVVSIKPEQTAWFANWNSPADVV